MGLQRKATPPPSQNQMGFDRGFNPGRWSELEGNRLCGWFMMVHSNEVVGKKHGPPYIFGEAA